MKPIKRFTRLFGFVVLPVLFLTLGWRSIPAGQLAVPQTAFNAVADATSQNVTYRRMESTLANVKRSTALWASTEGVAGENLDGGSNGEQRGIAMLTNAGIRKTTAEIMSDPAARLTKERRYRKGLKQPNRENLPSAAGAMETAQWPPADPTKPEPVGSPMAPQTLGIQFDGATGPTETGAFPPDTKGAIGPNQFFVFLNGRMRTFDKTTGTADGVIDTQPDVFFASVMTTPLAGEVVFTSDPNVRFDRLSNRWFLNIIDVVLNSSTAAITRPNRVLIAVSDAASNGTISAGTTWTFYQFQGDATLFTDYESFGIDASAMYIGANMFTIAGAFNSTKGFVIPKAPALAGSPLTVWAFPGLIATSSGAGPFSPRGVDNYDPNNTGPSAAGYFIGVDNATFSTLMLRRVTDPGNTSVSPTISANLPLTVPTTTFPNRVTHLGNTGGLNGGLDALDDRLFAAHMRNGRLWTAHNFRVSSAGVANTSSTARNASRWYEIEVPASGNPTLVQSGTIFDNAATLAAAHQYWVPSIMVSGQGHVAMGFSAAGTPFAINAATTGRLRNDPLGTMQAINIYTSSSFAYNPPADPGGSGGRRWGDYSFTSLDPKDDMTMWTIQEYCNGTNTYGVRAVKLIAPPPATPASASPANVAAGQSSVNITITGTSVSGSEFYDPGTNPPGGHPFNHISASVSGGVTVNSVTYTDSTHVTLNISTVGATPGAKNITITNPDGQSLSGTGILTIDAQPAPTTTSLVSSLNPSFATAPGNSVTFTASVTSSGNPVTTGTVTFREGVTVLSSNVSLNASGQAAYVNSALTEGVHVVSADYNGVSEFAPSSGNISQTVDNHTLVNGNSYSNPGAVIINDAGAASVYLSHIFVSGVSGTITKVTLTLTNLSHQQTDNIDMLLVGPGGQKFAFLSDVGGTSTTSNVNITLDDAAASFLPTGNSPLASGTFKPTNNVSGDLFPSPAPAGPYGDAAPVGTATFASIFNGLNPNGTWSLFVVDDAATQTGSVSGGWGLTITTLTPCPPFTNNRAYVNASAVGANNGTTWADAFTSLQSALAVTGTCGVTEIWVASGTYKPTATTDRTISFVMKNNLAIYGGFPNTGNPTMADRNWTANPTILSGDIGTSNDSTDNSYHVIFNNYTSGAPLDTTAVLNGFTITGGNANFLAPHCNGGGMYNVYASPQVLNCTFANNTVFRSNATSTESAGGGMFNSNSSPIIVNCTFANNQARAINTAGHSYGAGMFNSSGSPIVTNCTFTDNTTPNDDEDTYGGGMFNENVTVSVTGCTFSNNQAVFGGGIRNSSSTVTISNCTFSGNQISTYPGGVNGGAINNHNSSGTIAGSIFLNNAGVGAISVEVYSGNPILAISRCTFSGNNYGIANQSAAPTVTNCLFTGNTYGGVVNWTGSSDAPTIINCTFSENPGSGLGSISNYAASSPIVKNSILYGSGNSVYVSGGGVAPTITYSNVKQASGIFAGTGNINQDPLYVNQADPDGADNLWMTSDDGLRLQNSSPSINSGDNTGAPATDIAGNPRPLTALNRADMGAYESPYTPPFTDIAAALQGLTNSAAEWGDLDNDGDLDIVISGQQGGSYLSKIYRNDGSGTFTDINAPLVGVAWGSIALGDYDNDGWIDILINGGNFTAPFRYTRLYRNNHNSTFTEINAGLTGVQLGAAAWGDYNNDGLLDILLVGTSDGGTTKLSRVYRNNGDGTFTDINAGLTGVIYGCATWDDYDNDGDLDIALSGYDGSTSVSKVYRNNGALVGTFTDVNAGLLGVSTSSMAWGDFDNDGDLDLFVLGLSTSREPARLYRNDSGTFTSMTTSLPLLYDGKASWGDYDNDGDLDLAVAARIPSGGFDVPFAEVYRNDGSAGPTAWNFNPIGAGLTGTRDGAASWGDFDNDGKLDLIVTGQSNAGPNTAIVYRNNGATANTKPSVPSGLTATVLEGNRVAFAWNAAADLQTPANGLSYNLRVGTTPNGINKVSPMSQVGDPITSPTNDGLRRIPKVGPQQILRDTLSLPAGQYYWSVQAIDGAFAGGGFAPEADVNTVVHTFVVTNTNDAGAGSLRAAIENANLLANINASTRDTIVFNIPGSGPHTITPASSLPTITDPVFINGFSQTGASPGQLKIVINGAPQPVLPTGNIKNGTHLSSEERLQQLLSLKREGSTSDGPPPAIDGLTISAGNTTVQGLVIGGFSGNGVVLKTNGGDTLKGNFIGTDVSGMSAVANGAAGILVDGVANNVVGTAVFGDGNIISGNTGFGIYISGAGASGNKVLGNYIGTKINGTQRLPNSDGVVITGPNNIVGGTTAAERNLISGNNADAIYLAMSSATGNVVKGNYLGTDLTGSADLGNGADGVAFGLGANNNTVGGTTAGERNIISGNNRFGVYCVNAGTTDNKIVGNYIGTDATGANAIGNSSDGVLLHPQGGNRIGGTNAGEGNIIAFNGRAGVDVVAGGNNGNPILGNSIFGNAGLGIDLSSAAGSGGEANGLTQNDIADADTGANKLQNFPELSIARRQNNGDLEVSYKVTSSTSNSTYPLRIEFYKAAGGEGKTLINTDSYLAANAQSVVTRTFTPASSLAVGDTIVAAATDAAGNTSEFSAGFTVAPADPSGIISDDFNTSALKPFWTFINPGNPSTMSLVGTGTSDARLRIQVPDGASHDVWTAGNMAPRVMQNCNNIDFEVEVKFDSPMSSQYQIQGVVVEQDAGTFMRFDFVKDNLQTRAFAAQFVGGSPTPRSDLPIPAGNPSWMRVKRVGNTWTQSYSYDGVNFTVSAIFDFTLNVTKIGPFVGNAGYPEGTAPAFNGLVDYFFSTATPIVPEDGVVSGPSITQHPANTTVQSGQTATFTVTATGTIPLSYQWKKNTVDIIGATNPSYSTPPTTLADNGASFACVVSNSIGTVTSNAAVLTVTSPAPGSNIISDDFSSPTLNTSLWTVINPGTPSTFSMTGTGTPDARLSIAVPAGSNHDVWSPSNDAPRIMQPAGNTDFEVEVKFEQPMTTAYQIEGIIVEHSPGNYIRFGFVHDFSNTRLFAATFVNNAATTRHDINITGNVGAKPSIGNGSTYPFIDKSDGESSQEESVVTTTESKGGSEGNPRMAMVNAIYLRVKRIGNMWTQSYSTDGVNFVSAPAFAHTLTVASVGPYIGNAGFPVNSSPAFNGLVDYFFNTAYPIIPEDGASSAPIITAQPVNQTVSVGQSATFTVGASGSAPLSFKWQKNNVDISGATNPSYTTPSATLADDGSTFRCIVSNSQGTVTSNAAVLTVTSASNPSGIFSDDFRTNTLDPRWTVINPAPVSTFSLVGSGTQNARLSIAVPSGPNHDVWSPENQAPRIMQPANNTDFEVELKFEQQMNSGYQIEGVIVEESPGNYIRFGFVSSPGQLRVFAATFVGNAPSVRTDFSITNSNPLYLRVRRIGTSWTQSYSSNGSSFTSAGPFTHTLNVTKIGVYVGNAGLPSTAAPAFTGLVDYFFNTTFPIVPEDGFASSPSELTDGLATMARPMPTDFALAQNYPNPFNPSTTIEYALPGDAHVTIDVFDILGRRVAELENGTRSAGYHTVQFNGVDLASGIYFYKLTASRSDGKPFTQIRKLMLLK